MACDDCTNARTSEHALFNLGCEWCGARLIQAIKRLAAVGRITHQQRDSRCKAVLVDWSAYGHSETSIRRMAKTTEPALDPEDKKPNRKKS